MKNYIVKQLRVELEADTIDTMGKLGRGMSVVLSKMSKEGPDREEIDSFQGGVEGIKSNITMSLFKAAVSGKDAPTTYTIRFKVRATEKGMTLFREHVVKAFKMVEESKMLPIRDVKVSDLFDLEDEDEKHSSTAASIPDPMYG